MQKLKLSDIRKNLNFRISTGMGFEWNRFVNGDYKKGVVDFDVYLPSIGMNLQRPLCWSIKQKQEFILSILKDSAIPKICVITHRCGGDNNFSTSLLEIIDGKQRINAYIDFFKGEFALPTGHYYSDLADDAKRCLIGFTTNSDDASVYFNEVISDEDKMAWFEQINFTGTAQDEEHLNNLRSNSQKA